MKTEQKHKQHAHPNVPLENYSVIIGQRHAVSAWEVQRLVFQEAHILR